MTEYAIELGVYFANATIPPVVVMTTFTTPTSTKVIPDTPNPNLLAVITDLRNEVEAKVGAPVLDEQVFIRIFKR